MKTIDKEITWCEALALFMEGVDDIAFMVPKEIPDSLKSIRALVNDGAKFFTLKEEGKHFIEVESIEEPEEEGDDTPPPSESEQPSGPSEQPVKDFDSLTIEEVVALPKATAELLQEEEQPVEMGEVDALDLAELNKKFGVEPEKPKKKAKKKEVFKLVADRPLSASKGIIKALYEAGWKPTEIAKEVNLTPATISYHIKQMKEKGEIK